MESLELDGFDFGAQDVCDIDCSFTLNVVVADETYRGFLFLTVEY